MSTSFSGFVFVQRAHEPVRKLRSNIADTEKLSQNFATLVADAIVR